MNPVSGFFTVFSGPMAGWASNYYEASTKAFLIESNFTKKAMDLGN
jgi:hypothetical protein